MSNSKDQLFGNYIRSLRQERGLGQRELARAIGVSASYLNDIEKNKRDAPRPELVNILSETLDADHYKILDLAGQSRNSIPQDISDMISNRREMIPLLRTIKDCNLSKNQIINIGENIVASNTSAIIIAAGLGSRMKSHTEDKPKCLLEFGGKTLLERQLDVFRSEGIENISLVRGYKKEKINYEGITYFENDDYKENNILNSLFYGEEAIKGHVIVSYSDILFDRSVVARLLNSSYDISIVVDIDWRGYYVGRKDHPIEEAENVIFDADNSVLQIGKILTNKNDVHGEFIGMLGLSPRGAEIFKRHFHRAKEQYWDKPFKRAEKFQKAYITDMIQEMVDLGVPIHCVIIERGWKEIDTVEDYEKALQEFEN
ncbi:MAG: hypothetical protein CMM67_07910 [Rhodospirillaceae bacterium]|nr:hypothetical protein [Rhodospirillaceae bacterium]OUT77146.1 MAG: hypothetical protein CBB83_08080 [Rhodospirillaceae bacterium TMED23]|tara:strand:- start:353 stop:1468 length:1116 start_codon:yes stop_codon:yes gene_type:complete